MSARASAPLKSKLFKICLLAPPNCSSTHWAWFKVCVQTTACQFKCSQVFPCISYGHNFSMCTWITINKDSVVAFTWKKKSICLKVTKKLTTGWSYNKSQAGQCNKNRKVCSKVKKNIPQSRILQPQLSGLCMQAALFTFWPLLGVMVGLEFSLIVTQLTHLLRLQE